MMCCDDDRGDCGDDDDGIDDDDYDDNDDDIDDDAYILKATQSADSAFSVSKILRISKISWQDSCQFYWQFISRTGHK